MASCTHTSGATLCFECFRAGMERTRARQAAYAQRMLPFEAHGQDVEPRLSEHAIAHRRRMLEYLESAAARRA